VTKCLKSRKTAQKVSRGAQHIQCGERSGQGARSGGVRFQFSRGTKSGVARQELKWGSAKCSQKFIMWSRKLENSQIGRGRMNPEEVRRQKSRHCPTITRRGDFCSPTPPQKKNGRRQEWGEKCFCQPSEHSKVGRKDTSALTKELVSCRYGKARNRRDGSGPVGAHFGLIYRKPAAKNVGWVAGTETVTGTRNK